MKVSIEKLPDFFARRTQKNWPMTIDVFGAWFDDPDFFFRWIWHGQNTIWNVCELQRIRKWTNFSMPRGRSAKSGAYAALVKQFLKLAMTDVPVIPLYQPILDVVMQPDIKGYEYMFHRQVDARTLSRT